MTKEKTKESVIGGFTSSILRSHFGKGPTSVYVNMIDSFVCIQIRGFLSPIEKILIDKKESLKVLETRDIMMQELTEEFSKSFWREVNLDIIEFYADWSLEEKSGMILCVIKKDDTEKKIWPPEVNEKSFYTEVINLSIKGQKEPGLTEAFWLSDSTILIRRTEIFTLLEKELIKKGFMEQLKLAKRPLEYLLFRQSKLEEIMKRHIHEIYVDWNFKEDKGYAILVLQKKKER